MNLLKPITDWLLDVQAKQMTECFSCWKWFYPNHYEHYRTWKDQGEWQDGYFCDDCIAKKRPELLP
jgi:hypothetical protein